MSQEDKTQDEQKGSQGAVSSHRLATPKDKDNDQNEQQKANAAWPNEESSAAGNTCN
jgi:hypothetical protein